ncbi:hypothetical protein I4U23_028092 [Adineta vaga]|nr:hypothetical protein I4U23_028092 [Adineta vaga]
MSSTTINQIPDLKEHQRKVFFENLSPRTTTDSLKEYLSTFEIDRCSVPFKDGKSQRHGTVIFSKESSVNSLMAKRPHQIDGQIVELYRSVPNQGSLKEKKGVTNLIVSYTDNQRLSELDLRAYFDGFGTIKQIDMCFEEGSDRIEFNEVAINLKKGDRSKPSEICATSIDSQSLYTKMTSTIPKKSIMKQVQKVAGDFVERFNGKEILGTKIQCEVLEDRIELCKEFRLGQCKNENNCDWSHIRCDGNGKCPKDCPYGHAKGVKDGYVDNESSLTYRIKISGFNQKLTLVSLSEMLKLSSQTKYYIDSNQDRIGYIVQLKTMKFAGNLVRKLHNAEIRGQTLKCQIELNPNFPLSKSLSSSGPVTTKEIMESEIHRQNRSSNQINSSMEPSRDHSLTRKSSNSNITILNCSEIVNEGNIFAQSCDSLRKQKESDMKNKAKSSENLASCAQSKYAASSISFESDRFRQTSTVQDPSNNGRSVFRIEYKDTEKENYRRELNALEILKDTKGIIRFIESGISPSNISQQQNSDKNKLYFFTEKPSGYSLKEFVTQQHRGGFGLLEAIKLLQNLISIVKVVHSRGILHENLEPENIMINWDANNTPIDKAELVLMNFSQCLLNSKEYKPSVQLVEQSWYKPPQSYVESMKYTSTIDASCICAILLWLLTSTEPKHDNNNLPHYQPGLFDKLVSIITKAVRTTHSNRKQLLDEEKLKTYLIDTFNIAFGYPELQPWTLNDLDCRFEAIHELLSPREPKLCTTEAVFQDLISICNDQTSPCITCPTNNEYDAFQKASKAFQQAKENFIYNNGDGDKSYLWSDGNCTWLDSIQTSSKERRHDDILTFHCRDRHKSSSCSIIIICLATLTDGGHFITLSIGSGVNGRTSRVPIGRYGARTSYTEKFKQDFISELTNLVISIRKERRAAIQQ